ncbi:MAG: Zn-dependent exopeptidase M28 [Chloroflexi bacterium]|nr:Zn-dependent exopeptidase M28 [Chloroflexota bacterium]
MRALVLLVALAVVLSACGGLFAAGELTPVPSARATATPAVPSASVAIASPTATPRPTPAAGACQREPSSCAIADAIAKIDPAKMNDHLVALTSVGSRDPRHPGHAKAVAYIKEQLNALAYYGWKIETQKTSYQGIALENIFASLDGASAASSGTASPRPKPPTRTVLVSAHYDSTANRTAGWRPAVDAAPGADDNATGTAALLEFARVISQTVRERLESRITLAFFDGEELYFKGSAAWLATLKKPYDIKAAINLDMIGFNPLADRLDLLWYTNASAGLRDQVIAANDKYGIGVTPLIAQFAADGNTIMDAAPFGIAGIPSIALCQRYGETDATFPGNYTFHTVNDTAAQITNKRLWLKAAKLTLATALELASSP